MRFRYHGQHLPSGKIFDAEVECFNLAHFCYWLGQWNKSSSWRYWFTDMPVEALPAQDFRHIAPTTIGHLVRREEH